MKRSRKSNRVSWAPGASLCQVKLFRREDCPSQVGSQPQIHHKVKTSILPLSGMEANDFPPGFEGNHLVTALKRERFHIPQIEWKRPPKFVINCSWQVASGGESKELEVQKLREIKVLEAVYPHRSAIPSSPSVSLDLEDEHYDDSQIPLVPLTPVEDEEITDVSSDLATQTKIPEPQTQAVLQGPSLPTTHNSLKYISSPDSTPSENSAPGILPGLGIDVMTAASAALTALMKSEEQGSLIDTDLLVKILSDPKIVEKLINDHGTHARGGSAPLCAPVSGVSTAQSEPVSAVSAPVCARGSVVSAAESAPVLPFQPVTSSALLTGAKPAVSLLPLPSSNSYHVPNRLLPKLSAASKPDTSSEPSNVLATRLANGSLPPIVKPVQSVPVKVPAQSNPVPNLQATFGTLPVQPNSVPTYAAAQANPVKDVNYIKNLIREHGAVRQEIQKYNVNQSGNCHNHIQNIKMVQNLKSGELKTKIQKPCMYFKSSKGCRHGANCLYQHDLSVQWRTGSALEAPSSKRVKFGGEITGSS